MYAFSSKCKISFSQYYSLRIEKLLHLQALSTLLDKKRVYSRNVGIFSLERSSTIFHYNAKTTTNVILSLFLPIKIFAFSEKYVYCVKRNEDLREFSFSFIIITFYVRPEKN